MIALPTKYGSTAIHFSEITAKPITFSHSQVSDE
jgi:hypothetical protein